MRKYLLVLLSFICSCSVVVEEDSNIENSTITFEDSFPNSVIDVNAYLLGGPSRTWTTIAFTIEGINSYQNCRLDDQIQLNDDQTYNYDGGNMLCGAEDSQKLRSGNWEVNTSNRRLIFDEGTDHEAVFYIESLTDEEIVVSSQYYSWKVVGKFTHD